MEQGPFFSFLPHCCWKYCEIQDLLKYSIKETLKMRLMSSSSSVLSFPCSNQEADRIGLERVHLISLQNCSSRIEVRPFLDLFWTLFGGLFRASGIFFWPDDLGKTHLPREIPWTLPLVKGLVEVWRSRAREPAGRSSVRGEREDRWCSWWDTSHTSHTPRLHWL